MSNQEIEAKLLNAVKWLESKGIQSYVDAMSVWVIVNDMHLQLSEGEAFTRSELYEEELLNP